MITRKYILLVLLTLMHIQVFSITNEKFCLTKDGKSDATIIIDASAKGNVLLAAKEFQKYIKEISGANLPLLKVKRSTPWLMKRKLVCIGHSAVTEALGITTEDVGTDGYIRVIKKNLLAIVGKDNTSKRNSKPVESGTIHGVFALLYNIGVRNFFDDPTLDVIPRESTIEIPCGIKKDAPFFPFHWGYARNNWQYKIGFGGTLDPWPARHPFSGSPFCPIPYLRKNDWLKKYGKQHPEWFAHVNGKIRPHIRFSNDEVKQQIIKDAQEYFDKGYDYFILLQNDGYVNLDEAPVTQDKIDHSMGYYGFLSEAIMKPFIEIAQELEKTHPTKKVVLGAYHGYSRPPKGIKDLPRNAVVFLNRHRTANMLDKRKSMNRQLLNEWLVLKPQEIYLWEYYCYNTRPWFIPGYELYPRYIPHEIDKDIKWLAQIRSKHPEFKGEWLFFEFRHDNANAWCVFPNTYFTARLMWDPKRSIDAILEDFYHKAFGPAAEEMKAFYTLCEKHYLVALKDCIKRNPQPTQASGRVSNNRAMGHHFPDVHLTQENFKQIWPRKILDKLKAYLDRAQVKAKGSSCAERVHLVRKGFMVLYNGGFIIQNSTFTMAFDNGYIKSLINKANGKNYISTIKKSPIMKIKIGKRYYSPRSMIWDEKKGIIKLDFGRTKFDAKIKVSTGCNSVTFKLVSLTTRRPTGKRIEAVNWGNYNLIFNEKYPGQNAVGWNKKFAVGIVPLNKYTQAGIIPGKNAKSFPYFKKGFYKKKSGGFLNAYTNKKLIGSGIILFACPENKVNKIINRR